MKKEKFQYALKIKRDSTHGDYFKIPLTMQADVIIICWNDGTGLRPVQLCLPHQFSISKVEALFKEHPTLRQITIIQAKSSHYIDLFKKWLM